VIDQEATSAYRRVEPEIRRRGSLADEIAAYIRDLVLTGALKPGEKIDQDAVSRALDVSRSPIREALVVLGQEGLLDVTPRRGAFVARLTPDDIVDHYELFGVVSGRAAALAATTLDDAELAALSRVHDRFTARTTEDLSALNHEFHRLINSVAPRRTRWLLRLLERSVPANYYEFADGWNAQAVEHHAAILDALIARDGDAARRAMEHHLHESGIAAAEALRAQGFWDDDID
jgi:DNA-binding GntR family transcriptional regulator